MAERGLMKAINEQDYFDVCEFIPALTKAQLNRVHGNKTLLDLAESKVPRRVNFTQEIAIAIVKELRAAGAVRYTDLSSGAAAPASAPAAAAATSPRSISRRNRPPKHSIKSTKLNYSEGIRLAKVKNSPPKNNTAKRPRKSYNSNNSTNPDR